MIVMVILSACSPKIIPAVNYDNDDILKRSNQILYITIQAQKDTIQNRINTKIVQYQISNGRLKFLENDNAIKETAGSWRICLMDARERIIYSQHIENPFNFRTESFNENGYIQQHSTNIQHTQIPLRFPWLKQMKIIQIDTLALSGKTDRIFMQRIDSINEKYK